MAIDKKVAKKIYREAGLPTARDLVLDKLTAGGGLADEARRAMETLGAPVVVKPLRQGSSVGLSIVRDEGALGAALDEAFSLDSAVMLEEYLSGREFTCGVVGNFKTTALPLIEIIPAAGHQFFDYAAKYEPGQSEEICPANLEASAAADISRLAVAAHQALGCRGLSRTDFILVDGRPFLLETNTLPGMTSGSLLPKMARTYGLSFTSFISYLIDLVLEPVEPDLDSYKV
jgi:D-alanine-D-alanine ligase